MKTLILLTALILSSCASTTIPVPVPLPLPPPVEIPKVMGDELSCLSNDTYKRLVIGFRALTERVTTLSDIIRTTH